MALAMGIAAALYWAFRPLPILVELAPVTQGPFHATAEEDGKTRVRDRYTVSAPMSGRLLRIAVKAGDKVKANEAIAWIAPAQPGVLDPRSRREAEEKVGAAEAAVEEATARFERATPN